MTTKKYLDSIGISCLWLKVMQEFSNLAHKHDDKYLSLNGGTVDGTITADNFVTAGSTADDAVLGDGSTLAVSDLQVGATDKLPERSLWGNSFDGTADVSGDIKTQSGVRIDDTNGFVGFNPDTNSISLGWGETPESSLTSLFVDDNTITYKDNSVYHTGNFTYNGTDSTIYAPATTGTTDDILISAGTGAPVWNNPSDTSVGTVLTTVLDGVTGTTQATDDSTTKIATTEFVHNALTTGIAELNDALIYKGTIGIGGDVETLPETYSTGWTYKVITAGTYAGQVCEIGDIIIAAADGWTVVQNNTDIATTGTLGLVKGGTTVESEKIYGIKVSGSGEMTAEVPWNDTTSLTNDEILDLIEKLLHPVVDYLAFEALEDGTFSFGRSGTPTGSVSYSLDNGTTWTPLNYGASTPSVKAGSKVLWKGDYRATSTSDYAQFSSTGKFKVSGNIMSLMYGDDFEDKTDLTGYNYCFYRLFYDCSNLVDASNLVLPATTLATFCYSEMFSNCTSLTTAPELPAITLANSCYEFMFRGCNSLTTAPVLPATTLANYCYMEMFSNCTSLTTAPVLPATTLAPSCYNSMFFYCTSLTTAPELPATTLAPSCYGRMFYNCTSLTTAPELPATTLVRYCYYYMFYKCTNLNYIKAMFTTTPSSMFTSSWVSGVSSTGTFVKNSAATWDVTGNNGVPSGWTVETATA